MLELKNINVSFRSERQDKIFGHTRQQVLFDVSLAVKEGTCLGILGESGSGKSTMGRVLCGLLKPDSGEAVLDGVSVYASRAGRRNLQNKLSIVFQDYTTSANPRFRIRDIIGEGLTVQERREGKKLDREAETSRLLELVGLPDKADAYPAQLSGGQKQRIAIARALATDPKVLLCDEATSALDPNTTHAILQLIQKINRELGITVVIITHQMSVVEEVCNRVAILDNGTVVEEGSVQAIFSHPTSKAARRLVYPAGAPKAEALPGQRLVRVAFGGTQTTDKPLVASLAIECGALVSIMAADTRIVNGQTLGSMLLALPDDDKAEAAIEYIKNYPGITYEEVNG